MRHAVKLRILTWLDSKPSKCADREVKASATRQRDHRAMQRLPEGVRGQVAERGRETGREKQAEQANERERTETRARERKRESQRGENQRKRESPGRYSIAMTAARPFIAKASTKTRSTNTCAEEFECYLLLLIIRLLALTYGLHAYVAGIGREQYGFNVDATFVGFDDCKPDCKK